MSGRQRLPAGAPRKASKRRSRRAHLCKLAQAGFGVPVTGSIGATAPAFSVAISAMTNTPRFRIADRTYRVRVGELA